MTTFAPLTFLSREMFPFDSGKIPIEKTGMMALVVVLLWVIVALLWEIVALPWEIVALLWVIVALLWVMTERISF